MSACDSARTDCDSGVSHIARRCRELARHAVAETGEAHELQKLVPPVAALGSRDAADGEPELDVFGHRHAAEEGVVLEDEADLALPGRQIGDVLTVEEHPAAVDPGQSGDHPQHRALAAAGGSEEDEELPVRDLQGDVVDDRMVLVPLGELFEDDRHGLLVASLKGWVTRAEVRVLR